MQNEENIQHHTIYHRLNTWEHSRTVFSEGRMKMTNQEAIANLNMINAAFIKSVTEEQKTLINDTFNMAIKALEQNESAEEWYKLFVEKLEQEPKTGHCKDCRYFEYDSVAKVDEIPLIVAHEICNKWGDGCKTKEDGYCFLFEPQERNGEE